MQLAQREAELVDQNSALQNELTGLERTVRRQQEQAVTLQEEIGSLEQTISQIPQDVLATATGQDGEQAMPPTPDGDITGQVTAIQDEGQTMLVGLNVGSQDNVRPGMQFVVSRDGQYLGTVVVRSVDQQQAVANILNQRESFQSGDRIDVMTGL